MKHLILVGVIVAVAFGAARELAAQTLTDAQVQAAIERGRRTKPDKVGVMVKPGVLGGLLRDMGASALRPGASDAWNEFTLQILTPEAWIEYQAARAKSMHAAFEARDVSDEMKRPVVRLVARALSPQAIVIRRSRDDDGGIRVTPAMAQPGDFTDSMTAATFEVQIDSIRTLIADEFYVTVIMAGISNVDGRPIEDSRHFKVERKHLSRLPL